MLLRDKLSHLVHEVEDTIGVVGTTAEGGLGRIVQRPTGIALAVATFPRVVNAQRITCLRRVLVEEGDDGLGHAGGHFAVGKAGLPVVRVIDLAWRCAVR